MAPQIKNAGAFPPYLPIRPATKRDGSRPAVAVT